MMVRMGHADGLVSGLTQYYADTIRPALQIVGTREGVRRVSGAYMLILKEKVFFLALGVFVSQPDQLSDVGGGKHQVARQL